MIVTCHMTFDSSTLLLNSPYTTTTGIFKVSSSRGHTDNYFQCYLPSKMTVTIKVVTEWLVTDLLPYWHICCYIIGSIIGKFRSYFIEGYFVTLSGNFVALSVSRYIIGEFGVTLSVDVIFILFGVVT